MTLLYLEGLSFCLGGLALFLFGLDQCKHFFSLLLGGGEPLKRLTRSKVGAFAFGLVLAAATQSTTVAAGFAVGLVDLGALTLPGSIIVMMGSSVGTAFLVFLIAFNLSLAAPAGVFIGWLLSKNRKTGPLGGGILGISLVLVGMGLIKNGIAPLQQAGLFEAFLRGAGTNWLLLFITAAAVTALTQSSVPVLGLAVALGASGALSAYHAFPLILGSRMGNCVMVMISGLNGRTNARALAWATLLFRLAGVIVLAPFGKPLIEGLSRLTDDTGLLISWVQFIVAWFNVLLMLPFTLPLERISLILAGESGDDPAQPRFISEDITQEPLARPLLAREMIRLAAFLDERLWLALDEEGPRAIRRANQLSRDLPLLAAVCTRALARIQSTRRDNAELVNLAYSMNALREMTGVICEKIPPAIQNLRSGNLSEGESLLRLTVQMVRQSLVGLATGEDRAFFKTLNLKETYRHLMEETREELAHVGGTAATEKALFVLDRLARCATELARGERVRWHVKGAADDETAELEEKEEL